MKTAHTDPSDLNSPLHLTKKPVGPRRRPGRPATGRTRNRIAVSLPISLVEAARSVAATKNIAFSAFVSDALGRMLANPEMREILARQAASTPPAFLAFERGLANDRLGTEVAL